ncbi:unnamed protein product [Clonostachys rosea]|uniref:PNPLA domain-containing protein n=1 Tax=Bionectria ochroleuca TaxID=29856 RepID=A0ABY6UQ40_BIOOC|nr:unnamed protein product [Clonostachys rosea]
MATSHTNGARGPAPRRRDHDLVRTNGPHRGYRYCSDEEGPWSQKSVLSFDGGGIRGYSSLLILKSIMIAIRRIETSYPEHPVSSRTSTGGLSSIMLGRLRMSVDEALEQYEDFGNEVFGKARWWHERSLFWYPRAKYSSRKTREAFQKVVLKSLQQGEHSAVTESFEDREDRTRTMVISWNIKKQSVKGCYIWRSYRFKLKDNPKAETRRSNNWIPCNPRDFFVPIWQVARATTAAPRYFESIKIDDRKFLDGGMVANNPSLVALREIRGLHKTIPSIFVSLGTGLKQADNKNEAARNYASEDVRPALRRALTIDNVRRKQGLKKYSEIGRYWTKYMTDCEGHDGTNGWNGLSDEIGLRKRYRLNVEGSLAGISLDEWRPAKSGEDTLRLIRRQTEEYLSQPAIIDKIEEIAREVVEIRRDRAMTERWESFAMDVIYFCPICESRAADANRHALREHLEDSSQHVGPDGTQMAPEEVEARLNEGRCKRDASSRTGSDNASM